MNPSESLRRRLSRVLPPIILTALMATSCTSPDAQPTTSTVDTFPSTPALVITPPKLPTPTEETPQLANRTLPYQGVSAMKELKDRLCNIPDGQEWPRSTEWINAYLDKVVQLGANYIAIETPYENVQCNPPINKPHAGDAVGYGDLWINLARQNGLKIAHRHMFPTDEGIYDTPKDYTLNYPQKIHDYILAHADNIESGDIFIPEPEPYNSGVYGVVTGCKKEECRFKSVDEMNLTLQDEIKMAKQALMESGKNDVRVLGWGLSGFLAAGLENPDHEGKTHYITDETLNAMDHTVTIDWYPPPGKAHDQMAILQQFYNPSKQQSNQLFFTEFGMGGDTVKPEDLEKALEAVWKNPNSQGLFYFTMGVDGKEGEPLLEDDNGTLYETPAYKVVQTFFSGKYRP